MITGFIPNLDVVTVLAHVWPLLPSNGTLVLRSLDSAYDPCDLVRILRAHNCSCDIVGHVVCVDVLQIPKLIGEDVFTGFDEVWVISDRAKAANLARIEALTSDGPDFSHEVPQWVVPTVVEVGAILAVGDGCGLNYVVSEDSVSEAMLRLGTRV